MEVSLVPIPKEQAFAVWPVFGPVIATGCQGSEFSAEELLVECSIGAMQMWALMSNKIEGAGVTQIIPTPQGKVCLIVAFAGGDMNRWLSHLDEIELWAKSQGCEIFRIIGRKGWQRKLNDYTLTRVVLDKRL